MRKYPFNFEFKDLRDVSLVRLFTTRHNVSRVGITGHIPINDMGSKRPIALIIDSSQHKLKANDALLLDRILVIQYGDKKDAFDIAARFIETHHDKNDAPPISIAHMENF